MLKVTTSLRVRYAETDQMGYVYYGNYAQYFEVGRVEALRSLGYTYKYMEEMGVMMPVSHMEIKYIKPAVYDDLICVTTTIKQMPTAKMVFEYEIHNEQNLLLVAGSTTLVFVDINTQRITRCPTFLSDALKSHFE
jgi:acyl-CoA thioester hydrolase